MKVGLENYKTGTKNNWRRQCWNEVAARITNKKDAKIIYLAAEQDMDRRVAVSKGFSAQNMIAVDQRIEVVKQLRKQSKLAIHGKIEHVLEIYDECDVAHIDLCCGFTDIALEIYQALLSGRKKKGMVLVLNFLRGREQGFFSDLANEYKEVNKTAPRNFIFGNDSLVKHRGAVFLYMMFQIQLKQNRDIFKAYTAEEVINYFQRLLCSEVGYNSKLLTYKSTAGNQRFDTLILSNPFEPSDFNGLHKIEDFVSPRTGKNMESVIIDTRRQLAAIKAVQTMRKNGSLFPCSNF